MVKKLFNKSIYTYLDIPVSLSLGMVTFLIGCLEELVAVSHTVSSTVSGSRFVNSSTEKNMVTQYEKK